MSISLRSLSSASYCERSSLLSSHRPIEAGIQRGRNQAGDAIDVGVDQPSARPDVADRGLGAERAEGDDLRDAVVAVLRGDVVDHLVAAVFGEVDVDVGHLAAFEVQEALEDEAVLERIDVGDAECVKDDPSSG